MTRRIWLCAALALAAPAHGAERRVGIGSFDRLRVDGAFAVTAVTGRSPAAVVTGDRTAIDAIEVRAEGNTLIVRRAVGGVWGEQGARERNGPVTIAVSTPSLAGVAVVGGGTVTVDRMATPRTDLSVTGPGSITVGAVAGDILNAQVIGNGGIAIAGKAATVRLSTNGAGTIDAAKLDAGDLTIRLDGNGQTVARALYVARINSTGLGTITVGGSAKCTVKAPSSAPIVCGTPAP